MLKRKVPLLPRPLVAARLFTTLTFFANGFGIGAWSVAVAQVKGAVHATDGQMGFALLAFGVGAILAMSFIGTGAARFGVGKMCAVAGATFAVCLAGPSFATGLPSLALLLLLLGLCNGSLDVMMNARASGVESAWKAPIMSSFHAAWSFGGLLGAATGGWLARSHGLPSTLAMPAAVVAVLMVPACFNAARSQGVPAETRAPFAIPSREIVGLGAIAFLSFLAEGGVEAWTSIYLREVPGIRAGSYVYGVAAFASAMSVGRLCGDWVVRCYGQRRVVMIGASIATVAFSVLLLRPTLLTACCALVVIGVGLSNIIPIVFSAAGKRAVTPSQGVAMAATAGYAGFLIGPPVIGTIAQLSSLRIALFALPLAALLVVPTALQSIQSKQLPRPL